MTDGGETLDKNSQMFLSLVTSMHMGAMYQLGKVASPISGKVERNLQQAQYTIDLLGMLEARTAGNLTQQESEILQRTLSELRMNYLDEVNKPEAASEAPAEGSTGSSPESGSSESKSEE